MRGVVVSREKLLLVSRQSTIKPKRKQGRDWPPGNRGGGKQELGDRWFSKESRARGMLGHPRRGSLPFTETETKLRRAIFGGTSPQREVGGRFPSSGGRI